MAQPPRIRDTLRGLKIDIGRTTVANILADGATARTVGRSCRGEFLDITRTRLWLFYVLAVAREARSAHVVWRSPRVQARAGDGLQAARLRPTPSPRTHAVLLVVKSRGENSVESSTQAIREYREW